MREPTKYSTTENPRYIVDFKNGPTANYEISRKKQLSHTWKKIFDHSYQTWLRR